MTDDEAQQIKQQLTELRALYKDAKEPQERRVNLLLQTLLAEMLEPAPYSKP